MPVRTAEIAASAVVVGVTLVVLVPGQARAGEWNAAASIAPSVTYTDNVCLSNSNKKSEWIGTLTPSGSIQGKSRRASLNLRGSVDLNSLTNSTLNSKGCQGVFDDRDQFSPRIRANFNTILVENLMTLDVQGRADRNEVTSRASGGGDEFNRTGNTNNYYRYSISPRINRRLKDLVHVSAAYKYDEVLNSNEFLTDSHRHSVIMNLKNATPSRWSRAIEGRYARTEFDENFNGITRRDTELSSARLKLGYKFGRRWAVNGSYGWEWNDFQTTLNGDKDGNAWNVGVTWTPTSRTSVTVGSGDRFFGRTPKVNIRHTYKRHRLTANYDKKIRYQRDIRTEDLGGFDDNFDNPSVLTNGPVLDERLAAGWNYAGRRATVSINGNYSEQTRSEDGRKSIFKNVNLGYSPALSRIFSFNANIGWSEDEPNGFVDELPGFNDQGQSESWYVGFGVSRSFNNRISTSLDYRFTDRQGETSFNDYQENRVTFTVGIAL